MGTDDDDDDDEKFRNILATKTALNFDYCMAC